jgi:hypothetical protein
MMSSKQRQPARSIRGRPAIAVLVTKKKPAVDREAEDQPPARVPEGDEPVQGRNGLAPEFGD